MIAAPQQAEQAHGWKTIESAPKDGTDVLIMRAGYHRPPVVAARCPSKWNSPGWFTAYHVDDEVEFGPTHWQPLPQPPEVAS